MKIDNMTEFQYDFAVYIGRFQPYHDGHSSAIRQGLNIAKKVIVLVGSSNLDRSIRNPFTEEERSGMIWDDFNNNIIWDGIDTLERCCDLCTAPLPDSLYDNQSWIKSVQEIVKVWTSKHVSPRICIIGHERDNTSFYLKLFPQWDFIPIEASDINSTAIRDQYFSRHFELHGMDSIKNIPDSTRKFLTEFRKTPEFTEILEESKFIEEYKKEWGAGPFLTTDAVVVQSGHILMIRRKNRPGKGKWALPGGFLNKNERLLDGCYRELAEETGLFLNSEGYEIAPVAHDIFDDPHRSPRGRIITTAFLFVLPDGELWEVKGSDDAAEAKWIPISELRVDQLFEDHGSICGKFLRKI